MDKLTSEERSENMRRIRSKNTRPEMEVRSLIHGMGYRYRLHGKLPGKPDMIFASRKKVIFMHGCFWHQHDDGNCKITRMPKSNLDFWVPKLKKTKERDANNLIKLKELGWDYLIIWECQIQDKKHIKKLVRDFLDK